MALDIGINVDQRQLKETVQKAETLKRTLDDTTKRQYKISMPALAPFTGDQSGYGGSEFVSKAESERLHRESSEAARRFWEETKKQSQPRTTAAERYFEEHGDYGRTVSRRDDGIGMAAGTNVGGMASKALGWTLAAVGGFSVLSFLSQARAKYQQSVGIQNILEARGITGGFDGGLNLGMGPLEYMGLAEHLSQSAGMSGPRALSATRLSAAFGRAYGIDPSLAASAYSNMYQTTGNAGLGGAVLSTMEGAVKKGMDKARMSELMTMVARNTNITATAMTGAGISREQAGAAASLATASMALPENTPYKQFAKSGEFMDFMQNGMKNPASPIGEMIIKKAAGFFDGARMSYAKIHRMNLYRDEGYTKHPEVLREAINAFLSSGGAWNDFEGQAGFLESHMTGKKLSAPAAMDLVRMIHKNYPQKALAGSKTFKDLGSEGESVMSSKLEGVYNTYNWSSKQRRMAKTEDVELKTGAAIDQVVAPAQEYILNQGEKFLDSDVMKRLRDTGYLGSTSPDSLTPMGDYMGIAERAGKIRGLDPNLVRAVILAESGGNPNALSGAGAMGLMQLKSGTAHDMNVRDPYNPEQNVAGGTRYLQMLIAKYHSEEMGLAAYNMGPAAFDRVYGKWGKEWLSHSPKETRAYIDKVERYKNKLHSMEFLNNNMPFVSDAGNDTIDQNIKAITGNDKAEYQINPAPYGPTVNNARELIEYFQNNPIKVVPYGHSTNATVLEIDKNRK